MHALYPCWQPRILYSNFYLSVVRPKPKYSHWSITKDEDNPMNRSELVTNK